MHENTIKARMKKGMADLQTVLANLKNHSLYLDQFHASERSARFEHLVTEALSLVLRLPFYTSDTDDPNIENRVVWNGSITNWSKAAPGPDAIAYAYGFYILLEATRKEGTKQWSQEFAPCIDHYDRFVEDRGLKREDCYLLMLVTNLHTHTYTSIKQKVKEKCRFVLLPVPELATILDTKSLAFTAKHSDLRLLLDRVTDCCAASEDKKDFMKSTSEKVTDSQRRLLRSEKRTFVGVKSYKAINKFGGFAALSQILSELYSDSLVEHYFQALGSKLNPADIETALEEEKLAYRAEGIPTREYIYAPVPFLDVKGRARTIIKELENAGKSL